MISNLLIFHLLQISAKDLQMKPQTSLKDILVVVGVIAGIIVLLVVFNSKKGQAVSGASSGLGGGKSSSGGGGFFAIFAFHRVARNLGLDNDQTRMLDFVFKNDQVSDPERSIKNQELLDRHFRKTFRMLEQTQGNDADLQRKLAILFSTRNVIENSVLDSLTSTRQIKEETKFTVVYNKDKLYVNVLSTKGDFIDVEAPKSVLGSIVKIQKGTRLTIFFFSKNNKGFSFETRVVGYVTQNGHPVMQLAHSNHVRFLSQRRFRRRQAAINCILCLVIIEGTGRKQHLIADKRRFQGSITDVSVGGCSIRVMNPIKAGAMFKVEFQLCDMNLTALGQILRTNRTGVNTIVHMKFLKLSQKSMNAINSFVYEYANE